MTQAIAITGATGFVGRCAVEALTRAFPDIELKLLVRKPDQRVLPADWKRHRIVAGSLDDPESLRELVNGSDTVIHLAAAIAGNSAAAFEHANLLGTRRLVDAVREVSPQAHLIHVSSVAARAPGLSWYAASKRAAEEVVSTRAPSFSMLRPPPVYGPTDPALADFWRWLARGWLIRLGPADARFSLLHVHDLAAALIRLVVSGATGRTFELAGPQPDDGWTWPALGQVASACRNGPVRIVPVPSGLLRIAGIGALAAARLTGRPAILSPGKARELLHRDWVCDNAPIARSIGWHPSTPLERALATLPGWSAQ